MTHDWIRLTGLAACLALSGCQSADNDVQKSVVTPASVPAEPATPPSEYPDDSVLTAMVFRPDPEFCDACHTSEPWVPSTHSVPNSVHVANYGATGDGGAEHAELQRAIDAAGEGGRIIFESNRTYYICKMLIAKENQHWLSSGSDPATIKRCDTPVATLTADVSAGATALPVDDTDGFEHGMWVSPVQAGNDDFYAGELSHHPIYNISGNVLNVYQTLGKDYKAGDKVVLSFAMVKDNDGALFEGLQFDGNAEGNDHFVSWARHTSLWLQATGSRASHNRFINSQGDAISVQGWDNIIEHNAFSDLNGAAIHFSAAKHTIVRHNSVVKSNLEAARVVHAEAAFTWSLGNEDILVEHNCIQDIPAAAFGHFLTHGNNHGADIRENQICETDSLMRVVSTLPLDVDLLFTDNTVRNAGTLTLSGLNTHMYGFEISGNRFHNSAINAKNVSDILIEDNHFSITSDAELGDELESHHNKLATITIRGGSDITVADNFISGGQKGIQVYNDLARVSNLLISNNSVTQHTEHGIIIGHPVSIDSEDADQSDFNGVTVENNLISSDQLDIARSAVEIGRGAPLIGNCIESNEFGATLHGHTGSAATPSTQVSGNRINSTAASLNAYAPYTSGILISDNSASSSTAAALLTGASSVENTNPLSDTCHLRYVPTPKQ